MSTIPDGNTNCDQREIMIFSELLAHKWHILLKRHHTMGKRVFVSYSHKQGEWVRDRLYPVLRAGGAEVLIDVKRFEAGVGVYQQMDAAQDQAETHLLLLSPDYLASNACVHEMKRAVALDPLFVSGRVVPVLRVNCALPREIQAPNPVYVELIDDSVSEQWDLVTSRCGVDLGISASKWLKAREQVRDAILDGRSVNLVVEGTPDHRGLVEQLREDLTGLAIIDLASGATVGRQNLITEILHALGQGGEARRPPNDLGDLHRCIMAAPGIVRLAFRRFDLVKTRADNYRDDFFSALKFLVDERKLVLLMESRAPFATLLPATNPVSQIQVRTVELRGRTT